MTLSSIAIVFVCLALGGILKGATGAGAPILAVPALAMLFDVKFAVAIMLVPNVATNFWQAWRFRHHLTTPRFAASFAIAGALGAVFGTVMLANLPHEILSIVVAFAVFSYIGFRFLRSDWILPFRTASRISFPVGLAAGALQGASGISAPITLSFLNAMRLERPVFIVTVSIFFTTMTALQIPTAAYYGIFDLHRAVLSTLAILPILGFMPVGGLLARHVSRDAFDKVILALLAALALKLVFDALW